LPGALQTAAPYTHVFYRQDDGEDILPALAEMPGIEKIPIVNISGPERAAGDAQGHILVEPLLIFRLSELLNNGISGEPGAQRDKVTLKGAFTLRDTRVLVVDDVEINTIVAAEILRHLNAEVDTALSGSAALALCAGKDYDMIFMDHLMPVMDGMETTSNIRAMGGRWETVPIIALTANAVVGIRQFYLSGGMSGFLSKPIELPALHEALREFTPPEKLCETDAYTPPPAPPELSLTKALQGIPGLDAGAAMAKTGPKTYLAILKTFARVAPEKIKRLQGYVRSADWNSFRIEIHGQKSSLLNVGAQDLSALARDMEQMAIQGKTGPVPEKLEPFIARLDALYKDVAAALDSMGSAGSQELATTSDREALASAFWRISEHLDGLDLDAIEKELSPLLARKYSERIDGGLKALADALDSFDYDGAAEIIRGLQEKEGGRI
jgi:CheY-like chemotaxis protein